MTAGDTGCTGGVDEKRVGYIKTPALNTCQKSTLRISAQISNRSIPGSLKSASAGGSNRLWCSATNIVMDMPHPLDPHEVRKRAEELAEFTDLSEREAEIWARKKRGWTAARAADDLDVEESTAYEYERRAREKIRLARATAALAGDNEPGPYTEGGFVGVPTVEREGDADRLTPPEQKAELRACEHWLDMGIAEVGGVDLDEARRMLRAAAPSDEEG